MEEKGALKVELENGTLTYSYKDLSKLQYTGFLCQAIMEVLKEELTLEEITDLTKNFFVALDNQKEVKKEKEVDEEK